MGAVGGELATSKFGAEAEGSGEEDYNIRVIKQFREALESAADATRRDPLHLRDSSLGALFAHRGPSRRTDLRGDVAHRAALPSWPRKQGL